MSANRKLPLRWINTSQSQDQTTKNSEVYSHVTSRYRRWARNNSLVMQLRRSTSRILGARKRGQSYSEVSNDDESTPSILRVDTLSTVASPLKSTISTQERVVELNEDDATMQEPTKSHSTTTRDLILPSQLAHGNSDPFSTAKVSMTAKVNELLYLGVHRFVVFSTRAFHLSSKLRGKWLAESEHMQQECLSCAALTHAILASGYCARAALSSNKRDLMLIQARSHKIKAISELRHAMSGATFKPDMNIYHIMTNLASIDFAMGEPESAMLHHRAVTHMVKRPEFHNTIFMKGALGDMAEANIIRALAVQPNFNAKEWGIDISSTGIDDTFWYNPIQSLNVRQPPLKPMFDECRALLQLKVEASSNDTEEIAKVLTRNSLKLEKRLILLSIYYRNLADEGFLLACKKILVALTHTLLWFLDIIFIESIHRGYPHGLFEPYRLDVLFLECPLFEKQPVRKDLYLWLVFMVIVSETLSFPSSEGSSGSKIRDHTLLFHRLRLQLGGHYSQDMIKSLFSQYLYYDEIMDPVLTEIWPSRDQVEGYEAQKYLTAWS